MKYENCARPELGTELELLNLVTVSTMPQSVFQQVEKLLSEYGIMF